MNPSMAQAMPGLPIATLYTTVLHLVSVVTPTMAKPRERAACDLPSAPLGPHLDDGADGLRRGSWRDRLCA